VLAGWMAAHCGMGQGELSRLQVGYEHEVALLSQLSGARSPRTLSNRHVPRLGVAVMRARK